MRLPCAHFTVRRLVVVSALVAASVWVLQTGRRWRDYSYQAASHAELGQRSLFAITVAEVSADQVRRQLPETLGAARVASQIFINEREATFAEFAAHHEQLVAEWAAAADRERARAAYHAQLELKYLRAAAHPWRPVAPDPLPP